MNFAEDQQRLRSFLDDLWRWKCGYPPKSEDFAAFAAEQWSDAFERLMRNRLILGAFRYGSLGVKGKPQYDRVGAIKKRIDAYAESGNTENLVDVANLALIEFVESVHPKKHFRAIDDREPEDHVQLIESALAQGETKR